jgi:hypothetical protein
MLCPATLCGTQENRGLAGHIEAIGKAAALFFAVILVVVVGKQLNEEGYFGTITTRLCGSKVIGYRANIGGAIC